MCAVTKPASSAHHGQLAPRCVDEAAGTSGGCHAELNTVLAGGCGAVTVDDAVTDSEPRYDSNSPIERRELEPCARTFPSVALCNTSPESLHLEVNLQATETPKDEHAHVRYSLP